MGNCAESETPIAKGRTAPGTQLIARVVSSGPSSGLYRVPECEVLGVRWDDVTVPAAYW
jgi:hypothetical protein